ncbi:hypothetical protein GH153_06435 [bacterium]|nr:hypothetical protein [bacterium]
MTAVASTNPIAFHHNQETEGTKSQRKRFTVTPLTRPAMAGRGLAFEERMPAKKTA